MMQGKQAKIVGCVANFAQEVMKGQLSRLVGGLRGQGVEQFGRSEAFVSGPDSQLFLLDHVHEFDPNEGVLGCLERFEPSHGTGDPLDPSMILLDNIIKVFDLADDDRRAVLSVVATPTVCPSKDSASVLLYQ